VAYSNFLSAYPTWLNKGFKEAGILEVEDFASGNLIGQQYIASTIDGESQTRSSSDQYINRVKTNDNLKVYTSTMVKKVLFDKSKKATGVKVNTAGITYNILAKKEVIVSAGAFQSPQLLMVSGIGPAAQLEALDIPVIADLPGVGQNMWDHIFIGPSYEVDVNTMDRVLHDPVYLANALSQYALERKGPLTSTSVELVGWEKIPAEYRANFSDSTVDELQQFGNDWPEVEVR
jgi:choline dehydrogenase